MNGVVVTSTQGLEAVSIEELADFGVKGKKVVEV